MGDSGWIKNMGDLKELAPYLDDDKVLREFQ